MFLRIAGVLIALLLAAAEIQARPRIRLGGIVVSGGYTRFSGLGPYWYPFPYYAASVRWYPLYDPWWPGGLWYHPGYFHGFARHHNMGEVRIRTGQKDASVFLDGGYAGTAEKLKTIWLDAGVYQLEIRTAAGASYTKRIYVLSGKSLTIMPEFKP